MSTFAKNVHHMTGNDWKERLGVVYSTNSDYKYDTVSEESPVETIPADRQNLIVSIDRRNRAGKQVTLISGFVGNDDDLAVLAKTLKTKCGAGGSAKDGEIIIQGDFRDKVLGVLQNLGYKRSKRGN